MHLLLLLKHQPYIDQVIARGEPIPLCDYQIHIMSIPRIVKTRLATIPVDIPYITANAEKVAQWKKKLSNDPHFKIGICWQGNARYSTQALRRAVASKSVDLEAFKPFSELEGVSLYSLQKIDGVTQINECSFRDKLITFDDTFDAEPFMDSAAIMKHLDLVISVDTAPCHLAAAMGVPTWIILPFPADWRWLLNRSDSPWYPTVQLFRQQTLGDWSAPISQMVTALRTTLQNPTLKEPTYSTSHIPTEEQQQFFEHLIQTLE